MKFLTLVFLIIIAVLSVCEWSGIGQNIGMAALIGGYFGYVLRGQIWHDWK